MTDHAPHARHTRGRRGRRLALAVGLAALPLVAAACAPGVATSATSQAGVLTTRTVTVSATGSGAPIAVTAAPSLVAGNPGNIELTYNSSSAVIAAHGTLHFTTPGGATSATVNLDAGLAGMAGSVVITDPTHTIAANGVASSFTADDHGNVALSISEGGVAITLATASPNAAPGTSTALEALLAAEIDYCAEAQQSIAGLNPAQVPVASIVNTRETPRAVFAGSKSIVSPLTVRTWTDTVDVAGPGGATVTISKHISCKMRAADHIATTGVTTAAVDAACSTLNQRSFDLALAQMSPGEQAAVTVPALGADIVRQTGVDWTTPLPNGVEFNGTTLVAHALQTNWNDPAFAIFPDTIRGVHYCTVWAPAYAYAYLLTTLP